MGDPTLALVELSHGRRHLRPARILRKSHRMDPQVLLLSRSACECHAQELEGLFQNSGLQRSLLRPVGKSKYSKTTNLLKPPQGLTHPKAFRHGPMAESRLPASRRLRPGNQTPRPTIINTIGKTALPNNYPRALPNPHLRNRLHPPSPTHHHSSYQNLNNPRTLLLVPPSLPSRPAHHLRPKQHLARRNRQCRIPFDRLLHPLAVCFRSAPRFQAFGCENG